MSYAVKRFADKYWIEKTNVRCYDRNKNEIPYSPDGPFGITQPKFFASADEAWKWVGYLEEGVVDVPRPEDATR
jgi:hypothetical protein